MKLGLQSFFAPEALLSPPEEVSLLPWYPITNSQTCLRPLLLLYYILSQAVPMASWGFSASGLRKKSLRLVFRWFCMIAVHHLNVSSFGTEAPLWDSPDGGEGESSRWAELGELGLFCLQGEVAERKGLHQIMVWLESGTGRSTMKKWKGLKKRSEDRALWMAEQEDISVHSD